MRFCNEPHDGIRKTPFSSDKYKELDDFNQKTFKTYKTYVHGMASSVIPGLGWTTRGNVTYHISPWPLTGRESQVVVERETAGCTIGTATGLPCVCPVVFQKVVCVRACVCPLLKEDRTDISSSKLWFIICILCIVCMPDTRFFVVVVF